MRGENVLKKFINDKETIIQDMINGFLKSENDKIAQSTTNPNVLYRKNIEENKVGIVVNHFRNSIF